MKRDRGWRRRPDATAAGTTTSSYPPLNYITAGEAASPPELCASE